MCLDGLVKRSVEALFMLSEQRNLEGIRIMERKDKSKPTLLRRPPGGLVYRVNSNLKHLRSDTSQIGLKCLENRPGIQHFPHNSEV